jgi:hypothetical protein
MPMMRPIRWIGVLLLLMAGLASTPAEAQVRGRVEGAVVDARSDDPISRATVQVRIDPTSRVAAHVDERGRFHLGLPAGRRVLIVRAPGYQTHREPVQVEAGGTVFAQIKLKPRQHRSSYSHPMLLIR